MATILVTGCDEAPVDGAEQHQERPARGQAGDLLDHVVNALVGAADPAGAQHHGLSERQREARALRAS
jgi:hypothetical protein